MTHAIRFAGKFLIAIVLIVAALWLIRVVFEASALGASLLLVAIAIFLYLTASSWVRWLPALLIFSIINSFVGLVTHHAPTNSRSPVSMGVAGLLLSFYTLGYLISNRYDARHLSILDRAALVVYLFCMVWPAFGAPNDLSRLTPMLAWTESIGMACLVASFLAHRIRRGRNAVHA
jgi:hypothetical protein